MKNKLNFFIKFLLKTKNITIYAYSYVKEKILNFNDKENIDIVFLWVDGDDPEHKRKKNLYLDKQEINRVIEEKAIKEYRWANNDEINISLILIEKFCPWVSNIWIITDKQSPDLKLLPEYFRKKIKIVDHDEIFSGYENYLPTFNSRTIETFLWRINGLSEKFLYFNDDMFITRPVSKNDFFMSNKPVLRGKFKKFKKKSDISLHENGILNGALMMNFDNKIFFKQAHAPYVLIKSHLENLYKLHKEQFEKNAAYKFRSREQFLSVSLFYHKCIIDKKYIIKYTKDYLHLSEIECKASPEEVLINSLKKINKRKYKFICINDLGSLKIKIPDFKNYFPKELFD
jgi:hypothetical protein